MSSKELAKTMIDQIPEERMFYVISFLQGASIPNDEPNVETLAAFAERDNGGGHRFSGSTEDLFAELLGD